VLIRHDRSDWLLLELEQRGIIPRPLKPYGMEHELRITVGTASENERLISAMEMILG
jgi:histidinol-phosphate aminotransferase